MKKLFLLLALMLMFISCGSNKSQSSESSESKETEAEMKQRIEKQIKDSLAQIDAIADEVAKRMMTTSDGGHPYRKIDYGSNKHAEIESWAGIVTSRRLNESDIAGMSNDDLCLLRNLIFAIHGYRFKQERFRNFFGAYIWYSPMYNDVSRSLSSVETYNVKFIKNHEW